jgi:hypothetical protein
LTHIDPSWCARINAHRASDAPPPTPARTPVPAADPPPSAPPSATSAYESPYRLREVPREHVCECCGTVMYDHNCKIVCPNCGYKRDCSDP